MRVFYHFPMTLNYPDPESHIQIWNVAFSCQNMSGCVQIASHAFVEGSDLVSVSREDLMLWASPWAFTMTRRVGGSWVSPYGSTTSKARKISPDIWKEDKKVWDLKCSECGKSCISIWIYQKPGSSNPWDSTLKQSCSVCTSRANQIAQFISELTAKPEDVRSIGQSPELMWWKEGSGFWKLSPVCTSTTAFMHPFPSTHHTQWIDVETYLYTQ